MTITDEMLYEAAPQAAERFLSALPDQSDCMHEFSPEFERRLTPLLQSKKTKKWKKLLLLAAIIGALASAAYANRAADYRIYYAEQEGSVSYTVKADKSIQISFRTPVFTYVPEDYALESESTFGEETYKAVFRGINGAWFSLTQCCEEIYSGIMLGDYQAESIEIGGVEGILIQESEKKTNLLIWSDGPYILRLSAGNIDQAEIIHIASHIEWQ